MAGLMSYLPEWLAYEPDPEKSYSPDTPLARGEYNTWPRMFPGGLMTQLAFPEQYEPIAAAGTPESYQQVLDMAMNGPVGVMGIFAGPSAKTANLVALKAAQEAAERGEDAAKVFKDTGWFKGMDNKWRFEIDDSGAAFSKPEVPYVSPLARRSQPPTFVSDLFNHPALFEAYPELKQVGLHINPELNSRGAHSGDKRALTQGISLRGTYKEGAEIPGSKGWENYPATVELGAGERSTLLHELQHAVQGQEGFAVGGSPESMKRYTDQLRARLHFLENSEEYNHFSSMMDKELDALLAADNYTPEAVDAITAKYAERIPSIREANEITRQLGGMSGVGADDYMRLAGEIEARDVSKRMNLGADQRRGLMPDLRDDAIVRFR